MPDATYCTGIWNLRQNGCAGKRAYEGFDTLDLKEARALLEELA
jgi:hypothetical protein